MGNLMGCGGNRLEVDGEAVVEANSSSVQERIQYHKGVVDGLDVEIRKQATLETNAVDEIEKGKATLDKVLLNSRRQAALDSLSMLQRYMIDLENATFSESNEQKIWILLQANMEKRTFMREEEEAKIEILFC
ncbi:hypothetical protein HID58_037167 [Brassica napus]|uniref:Uncharacterized protein n=1 Tax=Brassica napus TaxID=3708 RepID=A0ABQ8BKK0_BRANA|nr:hypothetical protein HID58_037167 [Brassica napus]